MPAADEGRTKQQCDASRQPKKDFVWTSSIIISATWDILFPVALTFQQVMRGGSA
jgi:hypothetical protein